jgi:hypothetical protein
MDTAPCERCGEEIATGQYECPECGNNPLKASMSLLVKIGIALGVGGIFFPPVAVLGLFLILGAVLIYAFMKAPFDIWRGSYSPTNRDLDL